MEVPCKNKVILYYLSYLLKISLASTCYFKSFFFPLTELLETDKRDPIRVFTQRSSLNEALYQLVFR